MLCTRVLVPVAVAVGIGLTTFLYLATTPRWLVMRLGPYEILHTQEGLHTCEQDGATRSAIRVAPEYQ